MLPRISTPPGALASAPDSCVSEDVTRIVVLVWEICGHSCHPHTGESAPDPCIWVQEIKESHTFVTSLKLRRAVKKFGHPARMKKTKLKTMKRNKPKTMKILLGQWNRKNNCRVEVGGVGVEGMMTLPNIGALV